MCIAFVVEKPKPKPKPKPKSELAPAPVTVPAPAPAPAPGFFFDTRSGRYFAPEADGDPQADFRRIVEVPPPMIPTMRPPTRAATPPASPRPTRRRKHEVRMLESPRGREEYQISWQKSHDGGASMGLQAPDGVGFDTPSEAIDNAIASGLDMDGKNIHVMAGAGGGFFVVGVSDK
ncbi:hypothetical protein ABW20_dc0107487 [Dactylellina cionopaga]|nr:hypothetical protein ABW20_dc0107487 [Dactylellina cionopaga]